MHKPKTSEINQDVIDKWKSEHGKIMKWSTEDGKVAYFKSPDIAALDASASLGSTNPIKSNNMLAKACFLGGDEEVVTETKYITGINKHLAQLIEKVEGEFSQL